MSERFEAVAVTVAICTALLAVALAALLATLPFGEAPASGGPSAACREWSDGCVVCARRAEGLACSTPGIACTRGPARCLRP